MRSDTLGPKLPELCNFYEWKHCDVCAAGRPLSKTAAKKMLVTGDVVLKALTDPEAKFCLMFSNSKARCFT